VSVTYGTVRTAVSGVPGRIIGAPSDQITGKERLLPASTTGGLPFAMAVEGITDRISTSTIKIAKALFVFISASLAELIRPNPSVDSQRKKPVIIR
jgi:hypothetical protein